MALEAHTMEKRELTIMKHLRKNARETLTRMSRKTGIPVSTIYERLKLFETGPIQRHTCILDFRQLGYDLRMIMLVQCKTQNREDVRSYLENHHQVNTVLRVNNGFDFMCEVVFRNMAQVQQFMDALEKAGVKSHKEYYVLEELCRESFLTSDAHVQLLQNA